MNCFVFEEESSRQIHSTSNLSTTESSSASGFFSFNSVSQSSASLPNSMSIDTAESRTALVHIAANFEEFEHPKKLNLRYSAGAAVSTKLKLEFPLLEPAEQNEFSHWPNYNGCNVGNSSTSPNQEAENFQIPVHSTVMETRGMNPENRARLCFLMNASMMGLQSNQISVLQLEQKFTIREISPEWGCSTKATKVIIVGSFLCEPSESTWSCMFGDIEVPVEIIQTGVLCCEAPPHLPGRVTFCVTSGNRQSCSEIREFEYRRSCIHCNELAKGSTELEAELTANNFSDAKFSAIEDLDSLKNILAGSRSAAHAAERVQSAVSSYSSRKWQQREAAASAHGIDEYGIADIQTVSATSKLDFWNTRDYNSAALSIQKKYRRWKGRKMKVMKLQARVRGYQAGKQRDIIWAVGVLEKFVLRWRRKGVGFRGFQHDVKPSDETGNEDILRVFRKQKVDAAVDETLSQAATFDA